MRVSLPRGLANGTRRRAPRSPNLYAPLEGYRRTTEARIKAQVRDLSRKVGDHLVAAHISGKGRKAFGVVIWLEPCFARPGVEVILGVFDSKRPQGLIFPVGVSISMHALQRCFQRMDTASIPVVAKRLRQPVERVMYRWLRGLVPSTFAVPLNENGTFIFKTDGDAATAAIFLDPPNGLCRARTVRNPLGRILLSSFLTAVPLWGRLSPSNSRHQVTNEVTKQ